jgi:hypothetical protein
MTAPAIFRPAEDFGICTCPTCKRLDKKYPGQGIQLALFRYVVSLRSKI